MGGDPVVVEQLDAFSLVLPLPYRVAIVIVAGIFWLRLLKIDVQRCC